MADKIITQKVVTADSIDQLTINTVAGGLMLVATYHVLDAGMAQIGNQRALVIGLTTEQLTTLQSFVTSVVLPAVNTAEGT
jgi:hypothetical protein